MSARDLALHAFWSEHPLCDLYAFVHRTDTWSLKQLIAFAESLPLSIVARLS